MGKHLGLKHQKVEQMSLCLVSAGPSRLSARLAHHSKHTFRYKIIGGKPPSLPPAKTKRYEVEEPRWQEPWEVRELLWRRQAYNTALATIRQLFRDELAESKGRLGIDEDIAAEEEEDARIFQKLLAENTATNERLAVARNERRREDEARLAEAVKAQVSAHLDDEEKAIESRRREIAEAQRAVSQLVTRENLEERILEALETPAEYDYALDIYGIRYAPSLPPVKFLDAPPKPDTKWMYQLTPNPLKVADEDQRREKALAAGLNPDPPEPNTFQVSSIMMD